MTCSHVGPEQSSGVRYIPELENPNGLSIVADLWIPVTSFLTSLCDSSAEAGGLEVRKYQLWLFHVSDCGFPHLE